jgi:hypothetical protein
MDRKEKKKDIAVFANVLKDLMNDPLDDILQTLDRDIQHFIYGRISTLVKHNDNRPIGSIADLSAVTGVAFANVINAIIGHDVPEENLQVIVETVRKNFLNGFDSRFVKPEVQPQEAAEIPQQEEIPFEESLSDDVAV